MAVVGEVETAVDGLLVGLPGLRDPGAERLGDAEPLEVVFVDHALDGFEVVKRLRAQKQTPVLLLTAREAIEDKVAGLELGADDYLLKPFAYAEFLARIRSLLRRAPRNVRDILHVADLEVDLIRRRVRRADTRIDLTAQEFALLQLLAEREGEVLTRTFITSQIWDMNFDSDTNVVDAAIKRLRAKIDNAYEKKLIHTIRGMGYVLEDRS